ncbi:MAG: hypothetical protein JO295_07265 [Verrucomicrobia bacterium]|nr:hypothetical protein [Verrucomicrobiota bacterium]
MPEIQAHGFSFEKWVRDHFFAGYSGTYMQKWDVPPEHNIHPVVPQQFHRLPVSIKTTKMGNPIGLGDVLRQRQIDHDFLMIVGFWEQRTKTEKWFVDIGCAMFLAADWQALWGQLTLAEISVIDAVVKNQSAPYSIVRAEAQQWKRQPSVRTTTLVINPKIDSKIQRRIQCSLPNKSFWQVAGRKPQKQDKPELWNEIFPNPIKSSARIFN